MTLDGRLGRLVDNMVRLRLHSDGWPNEVLLPPFLNIYYFLIYFILKNDKYLETEEVHSFPMVPHNECGYPTRRANVVSPMNLWLLAIVSS
jgi:hypothetical protein